MELTHRTEDNRSRCRPKMSEITSQPTEAQAV